MIGAVLMGLQSWACGFGRMKYSAMTAQSIRPVFRVLVKEL